MNALQFCIALRPAIPFSMENPGKPMNNSELRRVLDQAGVWFNGERVTSKEEIDFPVHSVVFFPKSEVRRTTVW